MYLPVNAVSNLIKWMSKLCKFVCELLHGVHKLVFVLLRGLGPC